jgi:hypothetical protein
MEFGRAAGRSVTPPPEQHIFTPFLMQERCSPQSSPPRKRSKHIKDTVESHMGTQGNIESHMGTQDNMGTQGNIESHMGTQDNMGTQGNIESHMGTQDNMGTQGNIESHMGTQDNIESHMGIQDRSFRSFNIESRMDPTRSSTTHGISFPNIPRPSRSHTPACDRPYEFPRVPAASRGVTPVSSNYSHRVSHGATPTLSGCSQRSPSPEPFGRGQIVMPGPAESGVAHTHVSPVGLGGTQLECGFAETSVVHKSKSCYMCHFAEEIVCAQYATFVMNETARSSRNQIANQIAADIVLRDTEAGRPASDGASVADIERHIALHMLSPSVKVPELIRELDDVRRLMRASITNVCPDTGLSTVDTGNVALYLRVVREQIQVYKMGDVAKLSLASAGLVTTTLATDI